MLAATAFIAYMAMGVPLVRRFHGRNPYTVFLPCFLAAAIGYIVLFWTTPADLSALPAAWLEPEPRVDFVNGLLLLAMFYQLSVNFFYGAAFTGVSAQLFVIFSRHGPQKTAELIDRFYSKEKHRDMDPLTRWRLTNLILGGYVQLSEGRYQLLPKGRRTAQFAIVLKRLFAGGAPGG